MRIIEKMKVYLKLLRVKSYIKNVYIFIPSFFAAKLFSSSTLTLLVAFIGFSLTTSATYIFNDIMDIKKDKIHPVKKFRPIPSGDVPLGEAITVLIILSVIGFRILWGVGKGVFLLACLYFLMMILYSIYLKHIIILDTFIIAVGFVIRVFIGSIAVAADVSQWVVLVILMSSIFLAVAKRRDDMVAYEVNKKNHRDVILKYSLPLLDSFLVITATLTILLFIMFTVSPEAIEACGTKYAYLTTAFVIFSVFRYLKITLINNDSGDPVELLFKDKIIIASLLSCGIVFSLLLYRTQLTMLVYQALPALKDFAS